jgi:hypothetical protein
MAGISSTLVIHCRMALRLTQQEFGDLVGHTKRTVQRWETRGALLTRTNIEAIVRALHPVQPDLATQIATAGDTTLEELGILPPARPQPSGTREALEALVHAAADAMGVSVDAIRPALATAFARADEAGLDVHTVAEGLKRPAAP